MKQDSRWKQRFQNFENAFVFMSEVVNKVSYSPLEAGGLVQAFEFTFEPGWKTMKDYLYEKGVNVPYPRDTSKEAFRSGIISNGHTWIEMLEKRNELSHTYNKKVAEKAISVINSRYFEALKQVYDYFRKISHEG